MIVTELPPGIRAPMWEELNLICDGSGKTTVGDRIIVGNNKPIGNNGGKVASPISPKNSSQQERSSIPIDPTNQQYNNNPPPPSAQRAATAYFIVTGFIVVDIVLSFITVELTKVAVLDLEPVTKGILVGTAVIIGGVDLVMAFAHVSYAHWVVTGKFINNWDDLGDWSSVP